MITSGAVMIGPFAAWNAWQERRLILRDMKRRAADASERNRFKIQDLLTYANSALDNNDHRRAAEIWKQLSADYPPDQVQTPLALRVMIRMRLFDEATTRMRNGRRRHPRDHFFLHGLAQVAQAKLDHEEALSIYVELRKRFPGVMEGYTSAAESLRVMKRLDEAEALVKPALDQFPDQINPLLEYARIAVAREDWEEALIRWKAVRARFLYFGSFVGSAQALSQLGRYEESEELLQQARYLFGTDPGPLTEYARIAEVKGDIPEALERWKAVMYRFPLEMHTRLIGADAFERLGDHEEAVATIRAMIERFPSEPHPLLRLADLYHRTRSDFSAAAEVWSELRRAFPDIEGGYTFGADALRRTGRPEEAAALLEEHRIRFKSP
jgi:tetratricopeptide (TPR) repeat protein